MSEQTDENRKEKEKNTIWLFCLFIYAIHPMGQFCFVSKIFSSGVGRHATHAHKLMLRRSVIFSFFSKQSLWADRHRSDLLVFSSLTCKTIPRQTVTITEGKGEEEEEQELQQREEQDSPLVETVASSVHVRTKRKKKRVKTYHIQSSRIDIDYHENEEHEHEHEREMA